MSERLNIKNFVNEPAPKPNERPFDPERDISFEQYNSLESHAAKGDVRELSIIWKNLDIVGWTLNPFSFDRQEIIDEFDKARRNKDVIDILRHGSTLAIIHPKPTITPQEKELVTTYITDSAERNINWAQDARYAAIMGLKPMISDDALTSIEKKILQHRNTNPSVEADTVYKYAQYASTLKILGKEPSLTKSDWDYMRNDKVLDKLERTPLFFAQHISNLAILAADEVRIPEGGGLELINHKKESHQSDTPPLPSTKQF